jgi:hypothetical protein
MGVQQADVRVAAIVLNRNASIRHNHSFLSMIAKT